MKIKHEEIIIPKENPFENCKLKREPYANVLTQIVKNYSDGFVISLNNEWGAGKTTFVKMWIKLLEKEGIKTAYFNAWENDFDNNPLIAIISELESIIEENEKEKFNSLIQKGAGIINTVLPSVVKGIVKKHFLNLDEISLEIIENTTKATTEILKDEIKLYTSKKKSIIEFRKALEDIVKNNNDLPLVFVVDELDRCRPSYAIEVLEQIKHFFAVPGIVFVLSIDKHHLESSVKGFYGSEQINSSEYLRRFIDLEYSIPKPILKDFIIYLFEYYSFNDFFNSNERKSIGEFRSDAHFFIKMAELLFETSKTTLRQQDKIFAHTRLVLCTFKSNNYVFPHLLFFLIYLRIIKNESYLKIENGEFALEELSDFFGDFFYSGNLDDDTTTLRHTEVLLLWFYKNMLDLPSINLFSRNDKHEPISNLITKYHKMNDIIKYDFESINNSQYDGLKLDFLLERINLTKSII